MAPIATDTARVCLDETGVAHIYYKKRSRETLESARQNFETAKQLAEPGPGRLLCDIRPIRSVSREARYFWGSDEVNSFFRHGAMIVKSGFSRALGQFFLGLKPPLSEIRLFTSVEAGVEWLASCTEDEP